MKFFARVSVNIEPSKN